MQGWCRCSVLRRRFMFSSTHVDLQGAESGDTRCKMQHAGLLKGSRHSLCQLLALALLGRGSASLGLPRLHDGETLRRDGGG